MKFYESTRSAAERATATEAIFKGLAPDGGLYTPVDFSDMQIKLEEFLHLSAVEIAVLTMQRLLGDFSAEEIDALVREGYAGKFETEEMTPVVSVGNAHILELFRGPTCAFKDVALSLLPRLVVAARKKLGIQNKVMILTATSGDTGKAALEGFHDVPDTNIIVFYPEDGVSDVQKAQMITQTGDNVRVCAVKGNFDDAQTGVKMIFANDSADNWAAESGVCLSSANSINLGRLAPQVSYYFKAYADLVNNGTVQPGDRVNFVVPTGNFGDILAGEFARRMGLPVARLICASNANNVLTDFIRTGVYDKRREFFKTASPSMDILVSSNLERYLFLASGHDHAAVADMMAKLSSRGVYTAPQSVMDVMRQTFWAGCADDKAVFQTINKVWQQYGYLMDTHTAVGWNVMEQFLADESNNGCPTVVLSTASPYKFCADVLHALGLPACENGFDAMDALHAATGVPVPANLASLRTQPVLHKDSVEKENMLAYVKKAVAQ